MNKFNDTSINFDEDIIEDEIRISEIMEPTTLTTARHSLLMGGI